MLNTNITNFRKNIFSFFEQAIKYNESVSISTKDGNAVLISEEEYNGLRETICLSSIPDLREKPSRDSIRLSTIVCRKTKLNYKNWHRDLKNS